MASKQQHILTRIRLLAGGLLFLILAAGVWYFFLRSPMVITFDDGSAILAIPADAQP